MCVGQDVWRDRGRGVTLPQHDGGRYDSRATPQDIVVRRGARVPPRKHASSVPARVRRPDNRFEEPLGAALEINKERPRSWQKESDLEPGLTWPVGMARIHNPRQLEFQRGPTARTCVKSTKITALPRGVQHVEAGWRVPNGNSPKVFEHSRGTSRLSATRGERRVVQGWSLLARNWIAARMELPHANRGVSCITSRPTRQQEERGHCDAGSYASSRCHERQSTESAGEASREGPHASYDGRTKDGFPCHHLSFWSTRVMRTPVVCSY